MSISRLRNFISSTPKRFVRSGWVTNPIAPTMRVAGAVLSFSTSASVSPVVPAGVVAGDVLLCTVVTDGTISAPNTPAGWTLVQSFISGNPSVLQYAKKSDGTEGGTTCAVTWTTNRPVWGVIVAYTNVDTLDALTAAVVTSHTTPAVSATTTVSSSAGSTLANSGATYTQLTFWYIQANSSVATPPSGMVNKIGTTSSNAESLTAYEQAGSAGSGGNQALVWSGSANGFAVTVFFWGTTLIGLPSSTAYTVPVGTKARIREITGTNLTAVQQTGTVNLSSGPLLSSQPIPAHGSVQFTCDETLLAGESIAVQPYADGTVSWAISGEEYT